MYVVGVKSSKEYLYLLSIDDLPNEIFEKIITHLNVEDRKVASRVSNRWAQFAFSRITLLKPTDVIPPDNRHPLEHVMSIGFPNLKTLELRKSFLDRTRFSEQEVDTLHASMPNCTFYRKTRLKMADNDYTALM
ncbi:uncharacterized protein LOC131677428 isoform X3 [Topomyia yanbarensis]|uniref:uncharacterized protein LOC131677428 isoform X3 n=1 Tax=Topomyia yanbarensis TaxID=2498891 RepID=UPI00273C5345|nr:uncharacterized protein LOC131677428 isoform X3 [Topomyia yanbarensis]